MIVLLCSFEEIPSQAYTIYYVTLNISLARYEQRGSTQEITGRKGGNANKDEYIKLKKQISAY